MIKLYSVSLAFLLTSVTQAQYCTAVGPAYVDDSNLQSFYLAGESATAINFTGCPGVLGLDDQTLTQSVTLSAGSSYTAFAQFGTCGGGYPGAGEGWIDFNQNQIFEPTESIGTWSGTPPVAMSTWNFTVPAGAISGPTRMRVVQYEGGWNPIDPCASFTWGSTTDFTVQIGGGMDCSAYIGQSESDPRIISTLPYSENHSNAVCYYNVLPVYASADVFYRILPQQISAQFITVSLCGSAIDTYLTILDESGNVLYYNDDNSSCGTGSKIHFDAGTQDTLYFVVQGWGYEMGNYSILVEEELAGVSEYDNPINFSLYPNPTNSEFIITSNEPKASLYIHDISGKEILFTSVKFTETIAVEGFSAGTYFVTLISENGRLTQKLIVK